MDTTNAVTLEEVRREVIGTRFTGSVVLHCRDGRIEDIEVVQRRTPPWKRNGHLDRSNGAA